MTHRWYILNVHAGKEEFVAQKIHQMVAALGFKKQIAEVYIPKQSSVEVKDGKKVAVKKRMFPGYILVKMEYNEKTAPLLTNIEEVRGFVRTGNKVYPLSDEEVANLMDVGKNKKGKTVVKTKVRINDAVRIVDGVFKDLIGKVAEVNEDKGKVKVLLTMLGREVPYEVDISLIEKL